MSVFLIIDIAVKDPEKYSRYIHQVPEIIEKYGGCYYVRGGQVTPFAGDWHPERIIVVEFPNIERLQQCFQSEEYLQLAPLREQSTITRAVVVEGYAPK